MSDNKFRAGKMEIVENEIKSNAKRTIDEMHEEIMNQIQEELLNIKQVQKQITKIQKRNKQPDLSLDKITTKLDGIITQATTYR